MHPKLCLLLICVVLTIDLSVVQDENQVVKQGIKEDFEVFDIDQDGRLSKNQLIELFDHKWKDDITVEDKLEGQDLSEKIYIKSMYSHFDRFDLDKNGISMEEYLEVVAPKLELNEVNEEAL